MSESWDEFWTAEVDSLALEMFERSHEPSFTDDARGMGEAREWACRVIDSVRAEARREGQAEALRAAANTDDPDHEIEVALGGSDYVRDWLNARADRIENGADQ